MDSKMGHLCKGELIVSVQKNMAEVNHLDSLRIKIWAKDLYLAIWSRHLTNPGAEVFYPDWTPADGFLLQIKELPFQEPLGFNDF